MRPSLRDRLAIKLARPYLGWNNVRYTIETGLMIANLLGRELVLPGFTWATACEFNESVLFLYHQSGYEDPPCAYLEHLHLF